VALSATVFDDQYRGLIGVVVAHGKPRVALLDLRKRDPVQRSQNEPSTQDAE
jgi:hypothetical protein